MENEAAERRGTGLSGERHEVVADRQRSVIGLIVGLRGSVATVAREKIYRRAKVGFLGNGIDISELRAERFTPEQVRAKKRELGIPEGGKVVGMVGPFSAPVRPCAGSCRPVGRSG